MAKTLPKQNEKCIEPCISLRYNGNYRVRIRIADRWLTRTFDTLAEARLYRDKIKVDRVIDPTQKLVLDARARKTEAEANTLQSLIDRYCLEILPGKKGAKQEATKFAKLSRYDLGRKPIHLITRQDIIDFMNQLRREDLSETTVRHYVMLVSAVYTSAIKRWGLDITNPIRQVIVPPGARARNRRLEDGEFERLMAALRQQRNGMYGILAEFAVETAARRGELLALLWADVDIARRTALFRDTKNGEDRVIPLSRRAAELLQSLPRTAHRVFPLEDAACVMAFKRARALAGLENLRFHDLRHEATSRFFELGLDLMEVGAITGHKTLSVLRGYTHLRASRLAAKLDRV